MKKYTKQSEFKRNWSTLIEGLKIGIKERLEYPANTIGLLFVILLNFIIFVFIFTIAEDLFLQDLNWNIIDFSMFIFLSSFCNCFYYMSNTRYLFRGLLNGELNIALTKPSSSFIFQNIKMIDGSDVIVPFFLIIPILFLIFYYDTNFLAFSFFLISMCIYNSIFAQCIGSFAFLSKMLPLTFHTIHQEMVAVTRTFTPKVFEFSFAKHYIYTLYFSLSGFGLVELLLNKEYILQYFYYSYVVMIVLVLITYLNWKYGLKRYEAYG